MAVVVHFSVSFVCYTVLLESTRMTGVDSEIMEDTKNTPLADETDDSCELQLIEIVPLDRTSDDDHKPEFIDPVVEVKTEDLQDVKQEPADDFHAEDACFTIQVRSASTCVILCVVGLWYVYLYYN